MRRLLPLLVLLVMLAAAPAAKADVTDGSLEAGGTGWTQGSYRAPVVICTIASCGDSGGTAGPRTGTYFAKFGGTTLDETGSINQAVGLEGGKTYKVNYYLWVGLNSSPTSKLELFWGLKTISLVTQATATPYLAGYALVEAPIPGFVQPGEIQALQLYFSKGDDQNAVYSVDDISITERQPVITDYTCTVPKLKKGTKVAKVKKKLKAAKCGVKIQKKRSGKIKKGRLIKLAKKPGTQLTGGTKVKAIISKGK